MTTYSAIIVDDEEDARVTLQKFIEKYCPQVNIVAYGHDVASAIAVIKEHQPQILMLDINMPDGSGFDVLEQVRTAKLKTIFTTAYDEFAIKAFKTRAVDYLLKPINPLDLKESIHYACDQIKSSAKLEQLNAFARDHNANRIALPGPDGLFFSSVSDIVRCESEVNYTHVYMADKRILVAKTLKAFEDLLGDEFFRIHQSHLVNLTLVDQVHLDTNEVELTTGERLPISRRKRKELLDYLRLR